MRAWVSSRILLELGGVRRGGLGEAVVSFAGPGLLGGEVLAHLLGRFVRHGAGLVGALGPQFGVGPGGFRGRGALLGCPARGLDFGLGRARVAEGGHGAGEPLGDAGQLARQVAHLAEHLDAGDPRHGDRLLDVRLARGDAALGVGLLLSLPPCGDCVVALVGAVLRRAALGGCWPGRVLAAGELARRGAGLLGHDALQGSRRFCTRAYTISFHYASQ